MHICNRCGKQIIGKTVILSDPALNGTYCTDCHNRVVSEFLGIDFEDVSFEQVQIKDSYGKKHTFYFETELVPTGRAIEAYERLKVDKGGYKFSILGDIDSDPRILHSQLLQRIRKALKQRHLEKNDWDKSFYLSGIVRGRIEYDDELDGPSIVIDGKSFSLEDFGHKLMTFEGFQFRLEFIDPSEEVK
jgi:DNA-directed RNA polymerase subunit RPC12/RpoP